MPFGDETLLLVFSNLIDARDLVRCAATCRRWRRLVSSDAAYICRRGPPRCDRFIRRLALGVFIHTEESHGSDGFIPFAASKKKLSLAGLVGGECLRVVASRGGRVVLDLRRAKTAFALRLCVCDPMTGDAHHLPPLRGKDSPGPYACTLLTPGDGLLLCNTNPASYRVLLLYNHRSYSALRFYDSVSAAWGPEVRVKGARIGRNRKLGIRAHAALARGGVVCWPGLGIGVHLGTLHTSSAPYTVQGFDSPSRDNRPPAFSMHLERLLGLMPDGRLCVVESNSKDHTVRAYVVVYADVVDDGGTSGRKAWRWTLELRPMGLRCVSLRWFCERSGVVLFTAWNVEEDRTLVYAVDLETKEVGRVDWSGHHDDHFTYIDVCGYEMDRVSMLAEL